MVEIDRMLDILYNEDCLETFKGIENNSVDLVLTDPPYGISFMGKAWDKAIPDKKVWAECLRVLRVLKDGAFAFVMSIPRADCLSRMIISLEDAGFMVNFTPIYWAYASGFPKAQNISRAIEKRNGIEYPHNEIVSQNISMSAPNYTRKPKPKLSSPQAKALDGSYGGFQPKPAVEVIIVAMKPLSEKTYVDQALKNKKGITWLDNGRIPYESNTDKDGAEWGHTRGNQFAEGQSGFKKGRETFIDTQGRFPANLCISDSILDVVDTKDTLWYNEVCLIIGDISINESNDGMSTGENRAIEQFISNLSQGGYGNTIMEQYPMGMLSITKTLTHKTILSVTLNSDSLVSIEVSTIELEKLIRLLMERNIEGVSIVSNTSLWLITSSGEQELITGIVSSVVPKSYGNGEQSKNSFSRYFDLDKWFEERIKLLPKSVQKTFPFLIVPKASKSEKNRGLDLPDIEGGNVNQSGRRYGGGNRENWKDPYKRPLVKNNHPTVKPLKLMSYLITLGSREGDLILDPFMGSGTTALACQLLRRHYIGSEINKDYYDIAVKRCAQSTLI